MYVYGFVLSLDYFCVHVYVCVCTYVCICFAHTRACLPYCHGNQQLDGVAVDILGQYHAKTASHTLVVYFDWTILNGAHHKGIS